MRQVLLVAIAITGCSRREAPEAHEVTPPPPPSPVVVEQPAKAPASDDSEPRVIKTTSEIGRLENDRLSDGGALPPAIHGHGEALRGAWVAPDGTEFLTGYMYTGAPGPDTGVVYRRDPGGAWKIAYSKRENELAHLWGTSARDVWAAGVRTLAHWDGTSWQEVANPVSRGDRGAMADLSGVWNNGDELFVAASGDSAGAVYRRDAAGAWTVDAKASAVLYDVKGLGALVFAVGDDGTILHRVKAGSWTSEGKPGGHQNTSIAVVGPHDVYVAGSRLLHSTGDGTWSEVALPRKAQVIAVWGRSPSDVFAGTLRGLFHFDGTSWSATEWTHDVEAVAGNANEVLVANQHM